jgi:hypothetical protein
VPCSLLGNSKEAEEEEQNQQETAKGNIWKENISIAGVMI